MRERMDLQHELEHLLGSRNVYFQPPESIKMNYPAIRYKLSDIYDKSADNQPYTRYKIYDVTYIDANPDNAMVDKLASFPMCNFDRSYTADNLNHYIFTLYY